MTADEEAWDNELKSRERIFVLYYCTNQKTFLNAKASYRETYTKYDKETGEKIIPVDTTCEVNSSRLMKKPKIKDAIRKLLKLTQTELDEENTYRIINNLATMAFFNPADVITKNGCIKAESLDELGELAKTIAQIQPTQNGTKVTLIDRAKYMDLMMQYLNIVRPERQIEIKLPVIELPVKTSIDEWNAMASKEE